MSRCGVPNKEYFKTKLGQSDIHAEDQSCRLSGGPPYVISLARDTPIFPSAPMPWWTTNQQSRDTPILERRERLKPQFLASLHKPEDGLPGYNDITRVNWSTDSSLALSRPKTHYRMNWQAGR